MQIRYKATVSIDLDRISRYRRVISGQNTEKVILEKDIYTEDLPENADLIELAKVWLLKNIRLEVIPIEEDD